MTYPALDPVTRAVFRAQAHATGLAIAYKRRVSFATLTLEELAIQGALARAMARTQRVLLRRFKRWREGELSREEN